MKSSVTSLDTNDFQFCIYAIMYESTESGSIHEKLSPVSLSSCEIMHVKYALSLGLDNSWLKCMSD